MAYVYQNYIQPAQQFFGYNEKPYAHTQYQMIDSTQSTPYIAQSNTPFFANSPAQTPNLSRPDTKAVQRFKKFKRRVDNILSASDVISCFLTSFIEAVMLYMLVKFNQTKNIPAPQANRAGPWNKNTVLWPTYMMAAAAAATAILSLIGAITTCRNRKKNVKNSQLTLRIVRVVIFVGSWIAVSAFYRIAKTGQDLWGWSCDSRAEAIQQYYSTELHFESLCKVQTATWVVSIVEIVVKTLLACAGLYFHVKVVKSKKIIIKNIGKAGWDAYDNFSL